GCGRRGRCGGRGSWGSPGADGGEGAVAGPAEEVEGGAGEGPDGDGDAELAAGHGGSFRWAAAPGVGRRQDGSGGGLPAGLGLADLVFGEPEPPVVAVACAVQPPAGDEVDVQPRVADSVCLAAEGGWVVQPVEEFVPAGVQVVMHAGADLGHAASP